MDNSLLRKIISEEPVIMGDGSTGVYVERILIPKMFKGKILSDIRTPAEKYRNRDPYWSFMLNMFPEGREAVREAHRQYLEATSDHFWTILLMNTFRGNEEILRRGFLQGNLENYNTNAALNLVDVVRKSGREKVLVAASIGPSGDCYNPDDSLSREDAAHVHYAQLHALQPYVDFFLFETFPSANEMLGALDALKAVNESHGRYSDGEKLAAISFVLNPDTHLPEYYGALLDGYHPGAVFDRILQQHGERVLFGGFNCSPAETVRRGLQRVADYSPSLLSFVKDVHINPTETDPGQRAQIEGVDRMESIDLITFYKQLEKEFPDVTIKWGCCGIFPDNIRALHDHYRHQIPDHITIDRKLSLG